MNVIKDPWIPVRRQKGAVIRIAPWQVTETNGEGDFVRLASPRPDFDGALIQFLIGLVQTVCPPKDKREWRNWFDNPPGAEVLRERFLEVADYFELDGEGPRFMQDFRLVKAESDFKEEDLDGLLIETPGEQTVKRNTDLFVKREQVKLFCCDCTAIALFTLQTNAPSGGQGHRTSLRGGGPLSTILSGNTLWQTLWLNILEQGEFLKESGNRNKKEPSDRFPWLGQTRTSVGGRKTTPEDIHPDQNYWAMPRRIRLLPSRQGSGSDTCHVCGRSSSFYYTRYASKNLGTNYEGAWRHPLSPYFVDDKAMPSPKHPKSDGIGYRHWCGFVQNLTTPKGQTEPARVVVNYQKLGMNRRSDLRLRAFGFDMDNMKARCWHDYTMPLILADEEIKVDYEGVVLSLVEGAKSIVKSTRNQIKRALFSDKQDVKTDRLSFIESRFWQETEEGFYASLYELRGALQRATGHLPIVQAWHKALCNKAREIFEDLTQTAMFDAIDPKRVVTAWHNLNKEIYGGKVLDILELPSSGREKSNSKPYALKEVPDGAVGKKDRLF